MQELFLGKKRCPYQRGVLISGVSFEGYPPSFFLQGKLGFLVLRQQYHTVQAVISVSETISKQMVKFATE